jgi:hypothetical protein
MRNTIHNEALRGLAYHSSTGERSALVILESDDETELLDSLTRLGGMAAWGIKALPGGYTTIEADLFADRLLSSVIDTIA